MRKLIYLFIGVLCLFTLSLKAQQTISDPDKIWTVPSVYAMDEEVKWLFDFASASQVKDAEPLFLWIWSPSNPTGAPVPLTYEGDRVWSIKLTPTVFFGMTVQELFAKKEDFYFLIRDENATKLTGTLSIPKKDYIAEFVQSGKIMDYAPANFQIGSTLTILFNANLAEGFNPVPSSVHLHGALNDWDAKQEFQAWLPDIREKTKFKYMGNGIYKKDLNLQTYFGVSEEYELENLVFLAVKYNGNDASPDWAGASQDFKIIAPGRPIPPPANLYFFPLKVSINDILIITRDNNDRGQRLSYVITGGAKTITGDLDGSMTKQQTFIYIAKEFKDSGADKLHINIKDQRGSIIYDADMPLVQVDKPAK